MEWVASTFRTTTEHGVSNITTADAAHLGCQQSNELKPPTGRFKWTPTFPRERQNLVSAHVPLYLNWSQTQEEEEFKSNLYKAFRLDSRFGIYGFC